MINELNYNRRVQTGGEVSNVKTQPQPQVKIEYWKKKIFRDLFVMYIEQERLERRRKIHREKYK